MAKEEGDSMEKEVSQIVTAPRVMSRAIGQSPAGMPGAGMSALKHRRAKHSARAQIMLELTGSHTGGPGLIARALTAIGKAIDSGDPKLGLDAADRVIRLLPYILEKEGEDREAVGNALAKALGGSGPVQIVFGQHFHGRSSPDQATPAAGQALPGQAMPGPGQPSQAGDVKP